MWYLIVSIPDLCNLTYFVPSLWCCSWFPCKLTNYLAEEGELGEEGEGEFVPCFVVWALDSFLI